MKTRQPEFRAIPQFDSGRWKLRLEIVPVHPDNEITIGKEFDSAAQATVNETNEARWFLLPIDRVHRPKEVASNISNVAEKNLTNAQWTGMLGRAEGIGSV